MALQVEVAGDRRPQPADRVGERRDPDARRELGRVGGAADAVAPLEDEGPEAALARGTRR